MYNILFYLGTSLIILIIVYFTARFLLKRRAKRLLSRTNNSHSKIIIFAESEVLDQIAKECDKLTRGDVLSGETMSWQGGQASTRAPESEYFIPAEPEVLAEIEREADMMTRGDGETTSEQGGQASTRAPEYDSVLLGVSFPETVRQGTGFTATFVAYLESLEEKIRGTLELLSSDSKFVPDVERCRWRPGTRIKVKLYADHLKVDNPEEEFTWEGHFKILPFDVSVPETLKNTRTILKFDVLIDGIVIAKLRANLEINRKNISKKPRFVSSNPPYTAFASYASEDRKIVANRLAEIRINGGVNIYMDCLSLLPGEEWKSRIQQEIIERDSFLLFWSVNAKESEWVEWEWRMALKHRGIAGISPHPLIGVPQAPPPDELNDLHFGDPYRGV